MKEFYVNENVTLKDFTDNTYPQGSFFFERLLKQKDIKVNGVRVCRDCFLKAGDKVTYYLSRPQEEKSAYSIVYEDENVIVCDKENGVNSEALFCSLKEKGEYYFIHRLDRNTCGLIVFAKNKAAESELLAAFKERRLEKKYLALCFGSFPKNCDTLTAYLLKDEKRALVKVSDGGAGDKIVTGYNVIKTYTSSCGEKVTLAEISLITGKTHQIRAHMAYIGCPIVGDGKYGDKEKNKKYGAGRQCLLSYSIKFSVGGTLEYLDSMTFFSKRKIGDSGNFTL